MNPIESETTSAPPAEGGTQHGLDHYGIPAALLFAVGVGLRRQGHEVWVQPQGNADWIALADPDQFYSFARKWAIERLAVRVVGDQAASVCRELIALVDRGMARCLLRAGFKPVVWDVRGSSVSSPGLWSLQRAADGRPAWRRIFWRLRHKETPKGVWTWKPLSELNLADLAGPRVTAYCPDQKTADELKAKLKSGGSERTVCREVTVINKLGIHARPGAQFTKVANKFRSEIFVEKDGEEVNGKSIMGLMMLAGGPGSHLTIKACGADADEAVQALCAVVESRFCEE